MDEHQNTQSQRRSAGLNTGNVMAMRPGSGTTAGSSRGGGGGGGEAPWSVTERFFAHSTARRVNTDSVIASALKEQYPGLELSVVPQFSADLLSFAGSGRARATPLEDEGAAPGSLSWSVYVPPARRLDGSPGAVAKAPVFGKFSYGWGGHDFIVYLVDGRDGSSSYPQVLNYYVLSADAATAEALITAAGSWANELHEEIWVFDGGSWQKDAELYRSVRKASWGAVILDPGMKRALIDDHLSFFQSRETYARLKVPWKRGIIYYGPPGNGKTISIKAMMNSLYGLAPPVPTLYVRTLSSVGRISPYPAASWACADGEQVCRARVFHPGHLQESPTAGALLPRLRGPRLDRVGRREELLPERGRRPAEQRRHLHDRQHQPPRPPRPRHRGKPPLAETNACVRV